MTSYNKPARNIQWAIFDKQKKLILLFTPRAACSVAVQIMFEHMGLYDEAMSYNNKSVHLYRMEKFHQKYGFTKREDLMNNTVFKIVRNPYARAVSCYIILGYFAKHHNVHELLQYSFTDFLKNLKENDMQFMFNNKNVMHVSYHSMVQYDDNEDEFLDAFIKIEQCDEQLKTFNEKHNFTLKYGNKTSAHHTKRTQTDEFLAYTPFENITEFPISYKHGFYNDETKKLVEDLYNIDIIKYGYSFDEDF